MSAVRDVIAIDRRRPAAVRVEGTSALRLVRETEDGAVRPATRAPAPSRRVGAGVRALPVAVPMRRRPVHPTRPGSAPVAGRPEGTDALGENGLWQDVRPWGVEPAPSPARREAPPRTVGATRPARQHSTAAPRIARVQHGRAVVARRRAGALLGGTALTGALALGVGFGMSGSATPALAAAPASAEVAHVSVAAGQTLWEVAAAHTTSGEDVRETVAAISAANGLTDGQLQAGQVLEVPVMR